ncbi:Nodulin-like [Dillenia turbinata]|uniref:Nodulin-like n=1 Tax=Dillenia turbinata TaxID=194707 RepID=A0AAN8W9H1_9MAGN
MVPLKAGTRPPWVGLGAAVWVQIASGNAYNFPLYSHSLKSVLGFNQHQITMLGVANDIGENVGLLPGIVCNKFPPWIILSIGAFACFFGYGVLWLALSLTIVSLPYWVLWIALCIATNSSAWLSTAVLVTNMRNFPISRGTVAGILKGYGGLSAAVYTEIYSALLHGSSSKFLLFLALGIPILCFIVMYFIRACTPASEEDSSDSCHFLFIQIASIVLGVYLITTTVLNDVLPLSASISHAFVAVMILLLMAPLAIPIKMTFYRKIPKNGSSDELFQEDNSVKTEPLLTSSVSNTNLGNLQENGYASEVDILLAEGEGAVKKKRRPKRGEDFKFSEALVKADFWLLFFVYFVGVGSGVAVLNNLAQIGIAQGEHDTTILLSLFSFCNFVGRLGGGALSEHFVRTRTIPRTIWMTVTQAIMIIAYLLFASAIDGTLYAATALLGVCYGVQFSIMVPTASELFGLKNFGIVYNFMSLGNPLGAFLFSGLLAGYIYDKEAAKQHGLNLIADSISCLGPNCFGLTFLVLAGVCGIGSILSIILTIRIKPVYKMLYAGGSFRLPQASSVH